MVAGLEEFFRPGDFFIYEVGLFTNQGADGRPHLSVPFVDAAFNGTGYNQRGSRFID